MDPFTTAALIQGGASLIGGLGSLFGSTKQSSDYLKGVQATNEANRQLAQQQNVWNVEQWNREAAFNRRQWQETNAWNLAQWHRQNQYDSPAAQMSRLRAAGINPFAALSQVGSGGTASTGAQAMQAPAGQPAARATMQAPDIQGYTNFGSFFGRSFGEFVQGLQGLAQNRLVNAEADQQKMKNGTFLVEFLQRMANAKAQLQEFQDKHLLSQKEQNWYDTLMNATVNRITSEEQNNHANARFLNAQENNIFYEQSLQREKFEFEKQLSNANLEISRNVSSAQIESFRAQASELLSQIKVNRAMIGLYGQQAGLYGQQANYYKQLSAKEIEEKLRIIAQKNGIEFDNKLKLQLRPYIVESTMYEKMSLEQGYKQQVRDYYNPFKYIGGLLSGSAGAAIRTVAR